MRIISIFILSILALHSAAQEFPYTVVLNPVYSSQDIALQSYAYGTWENRVLLIRQLPEGNVTEAPVLEVLPREETTAWMLIFEESEEVRQKKRDHDRKKRDHDRKKEIQLIADDLTWKRIGWGSPNRAITEHVRSSTWKRPLIPLDAKCRGGLARSIGNEVVRRDAGSATGTVESHKGQAVVGWN